MVAQGLSAFKLASKFWGKLSFWGWVIGFYLAFMPLYVLGLMGVTRRLSQFEDTFYAAYFIIALLGALMIAVGVVAFVIQIAWSIFETRGTAMRRGPLGCTDAGMVHDLATALLQFCLYHAGASIGCVAPYESLRGQADRWMASRRSTCRVTPPVG